ncbi:hypothetical protein J2T02_002875 [Chitinophaga terrae (ex Kim and Jung 2007)]|nr:hypothetical protein [Chitinophaga terrae (ex Kim and Jung 2007)]
MQQILHQDILNPKLLHPYIIIFLKSGVHERLNFLNRNRYVLHEIHITG